MSTQEGLPYTQAETDAGVAAMEAELAHTSTQETSPGKVDFEAAPTRPCERCKGEKKTFSKGFTYTDSYTGETRTYEDEWEECSGCKGEGYFPPLDEKQILSDITTGRGLKDGKRRFRKSMTSTGASVQAARAYYVWRSARFHGGADMTMPVMAELFIRHDPYYKELQQLSDIVAKLVYGTDKAAAARFMGLI